MAAAKNQADETPLRWELAPHCCRVCLARVLVRTTFERKKVYRCSNCETEATGDGPQVLCCCGMKMRNGRDMGVRCTANPRRTPENPARIVAQQVSAPE